MKFPFTTFLSVLFLIGSSWSCDEGKKDSETTENPLLKTHCLERMKKVYDINDGEIVDPWEAEDDDFYTKHPLAESKRTYINCREYADDWYQLVHAANDIYKEGDIVQTPSSRFNMATGEPDFQVEEELPDKLGKCDSIVHNLTYSLDFATGQFSLEMDFYDPKVRYTDPFYYTEVCLYNPDE